MLPRVSLDEVSLHVGHGKFQSDRHAVSAGDNIIAYPWDVAVVPYEQPDAGKNVLVFCSPQRLQ
jgi:hypothetical protein